MSSTPEFRRAFVERLSWACDENPHIPPRGEGRQQVISERLKVAPEAVSKWFKAVSMPRPTKMRELAQLLGVDEGWLYWGKAPEADYREQRMRSKNVEGAVHLVWGMMTLAGANCGLPGEKDSKRDFVDFYATVSGSTHPIRVVLGVPVANPRGRFEVTLPREFRELRVIGVIPGGPGKYHFIDMDSAVIEKHKELRGGDYVVLVDNVSNRYSTDGDHWSRIITFGEFV